MKKNLISESTGNLIKSMLHHDHFKRCNIYSLKNELRDIINNYDELGRGYVPQLNKFVGFLPKRSVMNNTISNQIENSRQNAAVTPSKRSENPNFKIDVSRSKSMKSRQQDEIHKQGGQQLIDQITKDLNDSTVLSPRSLRKKYKDVIFDLKGKQSPMSSFVHDFTISSDIMIDNLINSDQIELELFLKKNEYDVFEILSIAIFLSIINLPEKSDKIFDQIQVYFSRKPNPEPTVVLALIICRIKNLSKLKFSRSLYNLTNQLEGFCNVMQISNEVLEMDTLMIRSKLSYCTNNFEDCFKYITKALEVCSLIGDSKSHYLSQFILFMTQKLFSIKHFELTHKILLMENSRRKKYNFSANVLQEDLGLEICSMNIKVLYKLGKFKQAIKTFESVYFSLSIDQRNQSLIMNENTMIEFYCYGILSYIKIDDIRTADELYSTFYGNIEFMGDERKMFVGIRYVLKGLIHMVLVGDANKHEKNVRRQADMTLRICKAMELDDSENNTLLLYRNLIKLYDSVSRYQEKETVASICIDTIESNYCKYHLLTFDFYIAKIESLIERQMFSDAYNECQHVSQYFEKFEEYLSEKQLLKLQDTKFGLLMDLVKLDELDDYLRVRTEKYERMSILSRNQTLQEMYEKAEEVFNVKHFRIVEENEGGIKDDQIEMQNLLVQLKLKNIMFQLKKKDFKQAYILSLKLLSNESFFSIITSQYDTLLICAKTMVKASKYGLVGYNEAGMLMNELINITNNTVDHEYKIKGMHLVAMYLYHSGDKLKSLEYLFQVMCYLETKNFQDSLFVAWDILCFKIKTLSLMAKLVASSEKNTQELKVYIVESLQMNLEMYNRLSQSSNELNIPQKLKILHLLLVGFRRTCEFDEALKVYGMIRTEMLEMNNGEFFYMHLKVEKEYVNLLKKKEDYRQAFENAKDLLEKVVTLSQTGMTSIMKSKIIRIIYAICDDGGFQDEKDGYDDTYNNEISMEGDVLEEEL